MCVQGYVRWSLGLPLPFVPETKETMKFIMYAVLGLSLGACSVNKERELCYAKAHAKYQTRVASDCPLDNDEAWDACEQGCAADWQKEQEACP